MSLKSVVFAPKMLSPLSGSWLGASHNNTMKSTQMGNSPINPWIPQVSPMSYSKNLKFRDPVSQNLWKDENPTELHSCYFLVSMVLSPSPWRPLPMHSWPCAAFFAAVSIIVQVAGLVLGLLLTIPLESQGQVNYYRLLLSSLYLGKLLTSLLHSSRSFRSLLYARHDRRCFSGFD